MKTSEAPLNSTRSLADADIVQLQAACFFAVSKALKDAGLVKLEDIAGNLSQYADLNVDKGWSSLGKAMAFLLLRSGRTEPSSDDRPADAPAADGRSRPGFAVIDGGLSRAAED